MANRNRNPSGLSDHRWAEDLNPRTPAEFISHHTSSGLDSPSRIGNGGSHTSTLA